MSGLTLEISFRLEAFTLILSRKYVLLTFDFQGIISWERKWKNDGRIDFIFTETWVKRGDLSS